MPNSIDMATGSLADTVIVVDENACPICGAPSPSEVLRAPDRFHGRTTLYTLMRCDSCGIVWTKDPPAPSRIGEHYGPDYDRFIAQAGNNATERWQKRRDTLAQYKSGGALLDLGCSSGSFLASLDRKAWRLSGIEMSPDCANEAKARTGADVFTGDILDAPFPAMSFDAVTCFHVFEHLYEPRQVLEQVHIWLKPGGIFYTIVPNVTSAGARVFGSYWYPLELPRHLYFYSPAAFTNLAHMTGFEVVSIQAYRELFIENSLRYLWDTARTKLGLKPVPMAQVRRQPGFLWKVVRKIARVTVFSAFTAVASLFGDGESTHVILRRKPAATPVA